MTCKKPQDIKGEKDIREKNLREKTLNNIQSFNNLVID